MSSNQSRRTKIVKRKSSKSRRKQGSALSKNVELLESAVRYLTAVSFIAHFLAGFILQVSSISLNVGTTVVAVISLLIKFIRPTSKIDYLGSYERILSIIRKAIKREDKLPVAATSTAFSVFSRRRRDQRNVATAVLLLAIAVYSFSFLLLGRQPSFTIVVILVGAGLILQTGEAAMSYRLRNGLYGTTEYEARQIIAFILEHSEGSDIAGGLGDFEIDINSEAEQLLQDDWRLVTS